MTSSPNVDQYEASRFYVEAIQVPNVDKLVPPPQPQQTPPEVEKMMAELQRYAPNSVQDLIAQEAEQ